MTIIWLGNRKALKTAHYVVAIERVCGDPVLQQCLFATDEVDEAINKFLDIQDDMKANAITHRQPAIYWRETDGSMKRLLGASEL